MTLILQTAIDGEDPAQATYFGVRSFSVTEAISTPFRVELTAVHPDPALALGQIVGRPARFSLVPDRGPSAGIPRTYSGVVASAALQRAADGRKKKQASSYAIEIVPALWLLTKRRGTRIFQNQSELEIALSVARGYFDEVEIRVDRERLPRREMRVQYAETDYDFFYRMLAEVGICFFFECQGAKSTLVLADAPEARAHTTTLIHREQIESDRAGTEVAGNVSWARQVETSAVRLLDFDERHRAATSASASQQQVPLLETLDYPANLRALVASQERDTPTADDRGAVRYSESYAALRAQTALDAERGDGALTRLSTNSLRLSPGQTFRILDHPNPDVEAEAGHLVVESAIDGTHDSGWVFRLTATPAATRYKPALGRRPRVIGLEVAQVVGRAGQEIDCDELGRVRVLFRWASEASPDETASCWVPVSQGWAGPGYGSLHLPRVGTDVIVSFLAGDPDRPLIVGRPFSRQIVPPVPLPSDRSKTVVFRSRTLGGAGENTLIVEDRAGAESIQMEGEREIVLRAKTRIRLEVGAASIEMTPDTIRLAAPHVLVHAKDEVDVVGERAIFLNCDERKVT